MSFRVSDTVFPRPSILSKRSGLAAGGLDPHEQEALVRGLEPGDRLHVVVRQLLVELHPAGAGPRDLPCGHCTCGGKAESKGM